MVTDAARRGGAGARWMALLAALVFVIAVALYARLLLAQGGAADAPVGLIATLLVVMAVAAGVAAFAPWPSLRLGLLSAVGVAAGALGILAIFSIGLLVLAGASLAGVAFLLNMLSESMASRWGASIVATAIGCLLGFGGVAAVFAPAAAPHVECLNGGASYSSGWTLFGGSGTGRSSVGTVGSADGRTVTGSGNDNGRTYHFTCRDGKLVEYTHS